MGRPRASKVTVSWQRKRAEEERPKPVVQKKRKFQASKHPMVRMLKEVEADGPLDPDLRVAMHAGFQSAHCTAEKFTGREIAKVRLASGEIKRTYACDVCGFVGSKVSQA
jgi:hypothetical protein